MLTPFILTTLITEQPKYIKPYESDIVVSIKREVVEPIKIELVELEPISYKSPVVQLHNSSNTYAWGNCTWYVKNKRPDLPNNLGNANTWVAFAAQQGLATGTTPAVGAVAQYGMHVAYVESVNDDGSFVISEMNYYGLNIIDTRTVSGGWQFIY